MIQQVISEIWVFRMVNHFGTPCIITQNNFSIAVQKTYNNNKLFVSQLKKKAVSAAPAQQGFRYEGGQGGTMTLYRRPMDFGINTG